MNEVYNIGNRRELFVDDFFINEMTGEVDLRLHHPVKREISFQTDAQWEGNAGAYVSIFQDGDIYRLYYNALHYRHCGPPAQALEAHEYFLCYAESQDGVHWSRPNLGIVEFKGSKANNIIANKALLANGKADPAHSAVFKDSNPSCPPHQKYKLLAATPEDPSDSPTPREAKGLFLFTSPDGIHFTQWGDAPIITGGYFDSLNLLFWDDDKRCYREYHRDFTEKYVRGILTSASSDLKTFSDRRWLEFPNVPEQALYTNQVQPYYRAPHIYMGFPMRYVDRAGSLALIDIPELEERICRAKSSRRFGTVVTDGLFMSSRDGVKFKRWSEAFIRPGESQKDSWCYGDNCIFWGMLETCSHVEGAPNEISLYATESHWQNTYTSFRRYTIRLDGFVSAHSSFIGGEITTSPMVFEGGNLSLNFSTSAAGTIRVEIQEADGTPIQGWMAEDSEIFGDDVDHIVRWTRKGTDVRPLSGKPIRLRFILRDADIYSFQFIPYKPESKYPKDISCLGIPENACVKKSQPQKTRRKRGNK